MSDNSDLFLPLPFGLRIFEDVWWGHKEVTTSEAEK